MALGMVRARPVTSSNEASPSAEACRAYWDVSLRQALSVVPWTFATYWTKLYSHLTDTAPEGLHALALPSGTLKVWGARTPHHPILSAGNDPSVEYEVVVGTSGSRILVTNAEFAEFQLTKIVDVGVCPASFQEAVATLLASKLAIPLAGTEQGRFLRKEYAQEYLFALDRAQTEDAGPSRLARKESKYISGRR